MILFFTLCNGGSVSIIHELLRGFLILIIVETHTMPNNFFFCLGFHWDLFLLMKNNNDLLHSTDLIGNNIN